VLTKLRLAVALAWLPAALYMALIWTISSLSLTDVSVSRVPLGDKGVHFVEYGVLAFLLAHAALRTWPRHHPLRTASLAVFLAALWGFVDEIHQGFVPGRSSEALDLVADTAGAAVGAALRYALTLVRPRLTPARGE
jgi:VanZ family protein